MGRIAAVLLAAYMLSGCALMTTVSSVAGAAFDGLFYMFRGAEESYSVSMRASLVAVRRGLEKSGLNVNILEPSGNGYLIALGNGKLNGYIVLERQTERLTTLEIKVRKSSLRQDSIERALVATIREQSLLVKDSDTFDFSAYREIYEKMNTASTRVGWFLPGTPIHFNRIGRTGWVSTRMPSGKQAYAEVILAAPADK